MLDHDVSLLRAAVREHQLLVLRDLELEAAELATFARRLGESEVFEHAPDPEVPEVLIVTNRKEGRTPPYWHSDGMMQPEPPSLTLFYAKSVPAAGSETRFLDAYAAYESLPQDLRTRLDPLRGVQPNGVEQPLVRVHPETGRKALYLDLGMTVGVAGMERHEAIELFSRLRSHLNEPGRDYRHGARAGDLLIWDNASTSHSATRPADPRGRKVMLRVTLRGGQALGPAA